MNVLGIPGSLEQLLQPVKERAVRNGLFPHSFEQLWHLGNIGIYLQKIKRMYQQEHTGKRYNVLAESGAKAEYYLASELKLRLNQVEGYLFNNPQIIIGGKDAHGVGLTSFPDHILLTEHCFLYLETKNWSKEYLEANGEEKKNEIARQIGLTQQHLNDFMQERGIKARPEALIYDHQGTLGERIGKIKVIGDIGEVVQMVKNSQDSVTEYQEIVEVFMKLYAQKE